MGESSNEPRLEFPADHTTHRYQGDSEARDAIWNDLDLRAF